MAKRQNRLKSIEHQIQQIQMLKDLEPNITPEAYRDMSDGLMDIAIEALNVAFALENGDNPTQHRLQHLLELTNRLPDQVR
jgi:hypothetical protein